MPAEGASAGNGGPQDPGSEDALPEGSAAQENVKYLDQRQLYSFTYQASDGQKIALQVTVKQAGGNVDVARRVAELCYAKLEAGGSREETQKYREVMCKKLGGPNAGVRRSGTRPAVPGAAARKKAKVGEGEGGGGGGRSGKRRAGAGSLPAALRKAGRLEGALRIEGRLASKKNHESINGVFAKLPEGYDGHPAYEKVALGDGGLQGCKRFLFYATSGKKWKISDTLGDSKGGFCFLKASDGGVEPPLADGEGAAKWHVFDGKGEGYNADPAVRSAPLPDGAKSAAAAKGAASSSSSSSSSSDDEDEDEDDAPESEPPSQPSQPSQPTAAAAARPAAAGQPGAGVPEPEEPSRVCAKAAVRAGLRCPCHYAFAPDCPARRL